MNIFETISVKYDNDLDKVDFSNLNRYELDFIFTIFGFIKEKGIIELKFRLMDIAKFLNIENVVLWKKNLNLINFRANDLTFFTINSNSKYFLTPIFSKFNLDWTKNIVTVKLHQSYYYLLKNFTLQLKILEEFLR